MHSCCLVVIFLFYQFYLMDKQPIISSTYRFQIAVNYMFLLQQTQTFEQRSSKPPNQVQAEALVVVFLDQLVQIDAARIDETRMLAE